jgi:acid phosphatase type 7
MRSFSSLGFLWLGLLSAAACAIPACKGSATDTLPTPDAGEDDTDAAVPLPCGPGSVSKGPWALAVDAASAKIRWEACVAGSAARVTVTPEAGGAGVNVDAVETPTVVTEATITVLAPNFPDPAGTFYMHEATLTGLAQGTCYAYVLAADASYKGRFCTARASGDALRFMAIGDTNPTLNDNTKKILAQVLPKNPDFVVHGGDIQYYSSGIETWSGWFPIMQPMLAQGAFFPAIGNHESEKPGEYLQYTLRFFHDAGFDGTAAYYRFESGGVWFFSMDTEQSVAPGTDQGTWLVSSLADASQKPGYRFSVIYFHKPFVTCGDTGDDPTAFSYYSPIFKAYKVPLVLQAHMHGYERFAFDGITYVTTGGGGGIIENVNLNTSRSYCDKRVASGPWYHALLVDVAAAAAGGQITAQAIDKDGIVRDSFQITPP